MSARPGPANIYVTGESYREKATRKFKENPFVPIGALATTAALLVAMVKMRRGESRSFNNWLRVRIVAQGLTICAIVVGTYSFGRRGAGVDVELGKTPVEADLEKRREEKMEKEKRQFEGRLKMAEEAHRAEVANAESELAPRGAREKLEEKIRAGANPSPSFSPRGSPPVKSGGVLGWLGWTNSSDSRSPGSRSNSTGSGSPSPDKL